MSAPGGRATGRGADGFAFVIQGGAAPVTGMQGGQIGYGGVSNSLAVEFDTFSSGISGDYHELAVHSGGRGRNNSDAARRLAETASVPDFADTAEHLALVSYRPGSLRVYIDDLATPRLTVPVQLDTLLDLPDGTAWIGFTAATGSDTENHDILEWHFAANGGPVVHLGHPAVLPDGRVQFSFNALS